MKMTAISASADARLWLNGITRAFEQGAGKEVFPGIWQGLTALRRELTASEWSEFGRQLREEHPMRDFVFQDPLTYRAFEKPRGYAGDAVMMDHLYGMYLGVDVFNEASEFGRELFRHIHHGSSGQAVRYRRHLIAELIDEAATRFDSAAVLAIASGHLREAELSLQLASGRVSQFVALDADAESLAEVRRCYTNLGIEAIHGSVRHLLAGKVALDQKFHLVYAAGLFDYLQDNVAQALTARMWDLTAPGGTLLIPNFVPDHDDVAYMEAVMDWHLIYRDSEDMRSLLNRLDPTTIASWDTFHDDTRSVVFLAVTKH
ncbi:MAG: class I SAM-dependent methyltransferase [Bryobacteraceae bacterium]|nr:class I SAM-dependent methyltransferase [Bryobacteraceae bacterium]